MFVGPALKAVDWNYFSPYSANDPPHLYFPAMKRLAHCLPKDSDSDQFLPSEVGKCNSHLEVAHIRVIPFYHFLYPFCVNGSFISLLGTQNALGYPTERILLIGLRPKFNTYIASSSPTDILLNLLQRILVWCCCFCGPFPEFEFDVLSPFWQPGLLACVVSLSSSLPVAFTIETVGLSTYSVGDRSSFVVLKKRFTLESLILATRSGERGGLLLLLKMLSIAGCVVGFVVDGVILV